MAVPSRVCTAWQRQPSGMTGGCHQEQRKDGIFRKGGAADQNRAVEQEDEELLFLQLLESSHARTVRW